MGRHFGCIGLPPTPPAGLAISGLFSSGYAVEIDANIRKQDTYFQNLENKGVNLFRFGFSPCFAGFLPSQSAADRM
jgi:hypothetical protein